MSRHGRIASRFSGWREQKRGDAAGALQTATIALRRPLGSCQQPRKIAARRPEAVSGLLARRPAHARADQSVRERMAQSLGRISRVCRRQKFLQQAQWLDNQDSMQALTVCSTKYRRICADTACYKELLLQAQAQSNNWHEVKQALASERKTVISAEQKNEWMKRAIAGLSADDNLSLDYLRKLYKDMPDEVRDDDSAMQTYIGSASTPTATPCSFKKPCATLAPALPDYVHAAQTDSITDQLKMCDAWQKLGYADDALAPPVNCAFGRKCGDRRRKF